MRVSVPATTANLGSGFDCLGLALDLWLHVEAQYNTHDIKVITEGEGSKYLPKNERNYFIRIINSIFRQWKLPPLKGLTLKVENNIPLSRGLGSSAAVTVAAVKIASDIAKKRLSSLEAINLAAQFEGHADNVAAAYYGGLVLTGMSDKSGLQSHSVNLLPHTPKALIAVPNYRMRTYEARSALPRKVPIQDAVYNSCRTGLTILAFTSGQYQLLKTAMQDRLHQYYRFPLMPGSREMISVAYSSNNNYGAAISGSGSTIIALGEEDGLNSLKQQWQEVWSKSNINGDIKIIDISSKGVQVSNNNM